MRAVRNEATDPACLPTNYPVEELCDMDLALAISEERKRAELLARLEAELVFRKSRDAYRASRRGVSVALHCPAPSAADPEFEGSGAGKFLRKCAQRGVELAQSGLDPVRVAPL